MSVTINADDPATIYALELAAEAGQWLRVRDHAGREAFGLPSHQSPGRYYLVTRTTCDCPDFRRHGLSTTRLGHAGEHRPCKHILAVRLHTELIRAQQQLAEAGQPHPARRRGHLSLVPTSPTDGSSTQVS